MADSEIKKKHLVVLYTGVNDHLPVFTEDDDDKSGKVIVALFHLLTPACYLCHFFQTGAAKVHKGKGLIDEEPAAAPNVVMAPTQMASVSTSFR